MIGFVIPGTTDEISPLNQLTRETSPPPFVTPSLSVCLSPPPPNHPQWLPPRPRPSHSRPPKPPPPQPQSQPPIATPAFRAFISHITDTVRNGLSHRRPWSELVDRSAFSKPESLRIRPPHPQKLRLLPRQLPLLPRCCPRCLSPHQPLRPPPPPPLPPRRLALPLPLPPLRSTPRHPRPHLFRKRDPREGNEIGWKYPAYYIQRDTNGRAVRRFDTDEDTGEDYWWILEFGGQDIGYNGMVKVVWHSDPLLLRDAVFAVNPYDHPFWGRAPYNTMIKNTMILTAASISKHWFAISLS
ncbi:hypothetical protein Vadar_016683 [Vaccinium darrowii]|uniref:Uncharacterized protein n=1 Tax=Vaccinium darrowii TaxID=229202 RepID=A0ACB7ZL26_9ERIC|nr:hypothetical protein Vadar_016683 [Vaccinium darrowii]